MAPKRKRKSSMLMEDEKTTMAPTTSSSTATATASVVTVDDVRELEVQVIESVAHANNIVDLLELCHVDAAAVGDDGDVAINTDKLEVCHAAIHALHRIFIELLACSEVQSSSSKRSISLKKATAAMKSSSKAEGNEMKQFHEWLQERYGEFIRRTLRMLSHEEPGLQIPALRILMDIVREEASQLQRTAAAMANSTVNTFPAELFERIVHTLISHADISEEHTLSQFVSDYLQVYDDVRFYTLKVITVRCTERRNGGNGIKKKRKTNMLDGKRSDDEGFCLRTLYLLKYVNMPTKVEELDNFIAGVPGTLDISENMLMDETNEENDDHDGGLRRVPLLSIQQHKKVFSECWLSYLRLPLPVQAYKSVLMMLHADVMPHMAKPRLLIDFFTDSYDRGGVISLLALNGLFILITRHNLDYPQFYEKLYAQLKAPVLRVRYFARFFRLLDVFLSSRYMPSYTPAAFIKRLARLTLSAPAPAVVVIVPFIFNLLKRFPNCLTLIHRIDSTTVGDENKPAEVHDPFLAHEDNPAKCCAVDSSLWELLSIKTHYSPLIANFPKIFEAAIATRPFYDLEPFLDMTYSSMQAVQARKTKAQKDTKTPLAFTPPENGLFGVRATCGGELRWKID